MKRLPALLFAGMFVAVAGAAVLQPSAERPRISGPYVHDNLTVFLLHDPSVPEGGDLLTRDEAVAAGALRVTEKNEGARVNSLDVENTGDRAVFLQAGETLQGGKQDRVIGQDTILPPRSGRRPVPVFCVEPNRWSQRASGAVEFRSNEMDFATKEQRLAVRLEKDQQTVWRYNHAGNLVISNECGNLVDDSFVATTADPAVHARVKRYVDALASLPAAHRDVTGLAFAVNGRMDSIEMYGERAMFRKQWPKLLRTAALAALARKGLPFEPAPTYDSVRALFTKSAQGEVRERHQAGQLEHTTRQKGKYVRFETCNGGVALRLGLVKMD